jgi:flagellar hook-basal body complex protein FliE
MNIKLSPINNQPSLRPSGSALRSGPAQNGGGFASELNSALKSVSASQNQATALQKEVQMENPKVSLEETMVAIQKAQIGFQAALHVRNRMVQAYTDIMNMQV